MNSNRARIGKNIICSILIVLIFFMSFITLVNLSFHVYYIKTPVRGFSMQPTINNTITNAEVEGDIIYINQNSPFTTNDIVVAKVSWYEHYIIKRVVGTPGDKIEICDEGTQYAVYVNDSLLYTKEKYGENQTFYKSGSIGYYDDYLSFLKNPEFQDYVVTENGKSFIQLGDNEYFLMGDNWGHTTDSISKGPVKTNEIVGKVDLIVSVDNKNPFITTWFMLKKIFS